MRNLLLTLSSLFYQDTSRDLRVGFRNATRGCQGCACVFKATLLGTPPALQLQIHALFQARGNFHYNLVPLVTRQAPFLLQPPAPSPSQRRLFLVVGPCFLPLESHQFSPASDFLVSGYWGRTRTSRSPVAQPLLFVFANTLFVFANLTSGTSFLRLI